MISNTRCKRRNGLFFNFRQSSARMNSAINFPVLFSSPLLNSHAIEKFEEFRGQTMLSNDFTSSRRWKAADSRRTVSRGSFQIFLSASQTSFSSLFRVFARVAITTRVLSWKSTSRVVQFIKFTCNDLTDLLWTFLKNHWRLFHSLPFSFFFEIYRFIEFSSTHSVNWRDSTTTRHISVERTSCRLVWFNVSSSVVTVKENVRSILPIQKRRNWKKDKVGALRSSKYDNAVARWLHEPFAFIRRENGFWIRQRSMHVVIVFRKFSRYGESEQWPTNN